MSEITKAYWLEFLVLYANWVFMPLRDNMKIILKKRAFSTWCKGQIFIVIWCKTRLAPSERQYSDDNHAAYVRYMHSCIKIPCFVQITPFAYTLIHNVCWTKKWIMSKLIPMSINNVLYLKKGKYVRLENCLIRVWQSCFKYIFYCATGYVNELFITQFVWDHGWRAFLKTSKVFFTRPCKRTISQEARTWR